MMPTIQGSGYPLVFKAVGDFSGPPEESTASDEERIALRVHVRALEGMQKEAVVSLGEGKPLWRLVSDEGPYLNGTDLAPFPLAFYTAGMQFSYLSELLRQAKTHGVTLNVVTLTQDNFYTMEGSAIRGDMLGGAKPAELTIQVETDAPAETVAQLIRLAERSSPAQAVMRDVLANTFTLNFNGKTLPATGVAQATTSAADPKDGFESVKPDDRADYLPDIITKLAAAEAVFGVEGGAASSLQAEQKRTLHIRGEARVVEGRLMETRIQLFKPIGSTFRFLCDESLDGGGQESAPPPLAYLSAGVGFCYMTQIGRYAHITKQHLEAYRIVQDNVFMVTDSIEKGTRVARALPVETHVFLDADEADETAQKTLSMSERTCFLHAAMRGSYPSLIQAELNGRPLSLPDELNG